MTDTKIYGYVQPIDNLFGGPVYCVAALVPEIKERIGHWDFSRFSDVKLAKELVDSLANNVTAIDYRISADEINYLGWDKAALAKLELAVARLAYEQKLLNPTVILGHRNLLPLKEFTCRKDSFDSGSKITRAIANLKRHWLITEHYAKCYPQYDIANNFAFLNQKSLSAVLENTVVDGFSLFEPLKKLPTLYVTALKQLSSDYILKDPQLTVEPYWWKVRYPDLPFFNRQERAEYNRLVSGLHDPLFLQWLPEVNEESKEKANGRRNRCHLDKG